MKNYSGQNSEKKYTEKIIQKQWNKIVEKNRDGGKKYRGKNYNLKKSGKNIQWKKIEIVQEIYSGKNIY